jgi:hypothetical protein
MSTKAARAIFGMAMAKINVGIQKTETMWTTVVGVFYTNKVQAIILGKHFKIKRDKIVRAKEFLGVFQTINAKCQTGQSMPACVLACA